MSANAEENRRLAQELLADSKELAEHRILVDLARNDVGRVCEIGSVIIRRLMEVEYYSHVMHIVSDVVGKLKTDIPPFQACLQSIPAGTLSGAPKIRALQLISELEPSCRGPYGGVIGLITDKTVDTAIFIRSALIKNSNIYWQTGAGIVADSIPKKEYEESVAKALGIQRVIKVMTKKEE